jgi:hypothetical protein
MTMSNNQLFKSAIRKPGDAQVQAAFAALALDCLQTEEDAKRELYLGHEWLADVEASPVQEQLERITDFAIAFVWLAV